ncbi:hypothetical protein ABZZ47_25385 [Streptomyces sp. NPDC006465]|uniref:hypothetical protein n=1 Tax=Streptomyces sp. NPDC006465 TaxID=3157174 RepID=UPI0033BBBF8B
MPGLWDASLKQLYFADYQTTFTADTLTIGQQYDVIADIEIGASLNSFAGEDRLVVTVTNLTTNQVVQTRTVPRPLQPSATVRRQPLVINFPALDATMVSDGDVLRATGSYRVSAGVNTDHDASQSGTTIAVN